MEDERMLSFRKRAFQNYQAERARLKTLTAHEMEKAGEADENERESYSIDERREVTILLSCGGPSDGYRVYFTTEGKAVEGYYFFANWFEYEQFRLSPEELDRVLAVYPGLSML